LLEVWLADTDITDDDLKHIAELRYPYRIDLRNTEITDAGLKWLKTLCNTDCLELGGTQVTDEGVGELRRALPECRTVD